MKMSASKYIAQLVADSGITDVFTVVGGGSMWMNEAFSHHPKLTTCYNHHEQACAIAAEAYSRINRKMAALVCTTGPGGTNTITGVVGGWLDSIPMLIISGQVRYATMARSTGLPLRSMGDQEFDITKSISCMTKYCELILDPKKIRYCVEKAIFIARNGRPGPCWLDVPLDIQGATIETDEQIPFDPQEYMKDIPMDISDDKVKAVIEKVKEAKRPIIYAGNGIRLSGGFDAFKEMVRKLNVPVLTNWNSIDLIADDDPLYAGRGGNQGNRFGNFAMQNSDLIIAIGSRLSFRETGFNYEHWAEHAYVIMEDIDPYELKKPNVHVDMPLNVDAKVLMEKICKFADGPVFKGNDWIEQCRVWKEKYPVVQEKHYVDIDGCANPYCFMKEVSRRLPEGMITVVGNGTACAAGSHAYVIKEGQRFIVNAAIASMGYDLPAAIGACIADHRKELVCITGEGSIQMNLQELQTIITNKLPIKLFIINNGGYHSMRQTEIKLFNGDFFGMGRESGDVEFPEMSKLADVYGYPYYRINNNEEMDVIDRVLAEKGPCICEVFVNTKQFFEPKSATKRLEDGTLYSPPLDDMEPFLSPEELKSNMYY